MGILTNIVISQYIFFIEACGNLKTSCLECKGGIVTQSLISFHFICILLCFVLFHFNLI